MTRSLLTDLVEISFANNTLNEKVVKDIAEKLSRRELKAYIKALKAELRRRSVTIISAKPLTKELKEAYEKKFSGKRLDFQIRDDILLGVKIIDNDMVYDNSLKGSLSRIEQFVRE